jgi:hypothetical protein
MTYEIETDADGMVVHFEDLDKAAMLRDERAIDKIATLLGTAEVWRVDYLEIVADIIGTVRPHPGGNDGNGYAIDFHNATGRDVVAEYDMQQPAE